MKKHISKKNDFKKKKHYNLIVEIMKMTDERGDCMKNDFSQGKVWRNIISQAIPLILAQLVQILYNVVDRIYIGHLPGENNIALTGVGLVFPIITLIMAFTCLFSMGGNPLFAIARGAKAASE